MKSIFDPSTINELKSRIDNLGPTATANWGKMNIYQMLRHCIENEFVLLKEQRYPTRFLGRIIGKRALKPILKNDKELKQNLPTHPQLKFEKVYTTIEHLKKLWINALEQYTTKSSADYNDFIHPFFGKMSKQEIDIFAYKHVDHHLRQFGV